MSALSSSTRAHGDDVLTMSTSRRRDINHLVQTLKAAEDRKNYTVENTSVSIGNILRIEDSLLPALLPNVQRRVTHSAGIKRAYTPLLESYKRSLTLPPDMTDEDRDRVRMLRQDPFSHRVAAAGRLRKWDDVLQSIAGSEWHLSPRLQRDGVTDDVEEPRFSGTPRALKASHHGIHVTPVGRMTQDITFRRFETFASRGEHSSPSAESCKSPAGRLSPSSARDVSSHRGRHLLPEPPKPHLPQSRIPLSSARRSAENAPRAAKFREHKQSHVHGHGIPQGGTPVVSTCATDADVVAEGSSCDVSPERGFPGADQLQTVAAFNELKRNAVRIDVVSPTTTTLTPEMFLRVEDDFLRLTGGRKSRILLPSDLSTDIKLGGNTFSRRRLNFLMTAENGGGVSFVQLLLYAFPFVSTARIDALMLRYSTSMNPLLGGPLEVRADPAVFRAIEKLYMRFDTDGDGVVNIDDIVIKQAKLAMADAADDKTADFESARNHVRTEYDGTVTLESFAVFTRFLFPPYKVLE